MRYIFLVLFIISISFSKAQVVKNVQHIGWRDGIVENVKLKSFPNKDRSLNCVVITKGDSIIAKVYNSKLEVVYTFRTTNLKFKMPLDFSPVGGYFSDELLTVVLKNSPYNLVSIVYNLKTAEIKKYHSAIDKKKNYVTTINAGDNCYQILHIKKSPILSVLSIGNNGVNQEQVFDLNKGTNTGISDNELFIGLSTYEALLTRPVKIAIVDKDIITGADDAAMKCKMYLNGDTIMLSIDNVKSQTKIFKLNLNNNKVDYLPILYNIERDSVENSNTYPNETSVPLPTSFSSTIIDNVIYHVYVTSKKLRLSATNLYNGELLFLDQTNALDVINYLNTDIIQDGTSFSGKGTKQLTTSQLLNKMIRGKAVISGIKNNGKKHELTIGSYRKLQSGGGAVPTMGGFGGGGMITGMTFNFAMSRSWDITTRFKTLFDPITVKHIEGEISESGTDLIDDYFKDVKMPNQGSDTFFSDGNTYYTYYNNDTKNLEVILLK